MGALAAFKEGEISKEKFVEFCEESGLMGVLDDFEEGEFSWNELVEICEDNFGISQQELEAIMYPEGQMEEEDSMFAGVDDHLSTPHKSTVSDDVILKSMEDNDLTKTPLIKEDGTPDK